VRGGEPAPAWGKREVQEGGTGLGYAGWLCARRLRISRSGGKSDDAVHGKVDKLFVFRRREAELRITMMLKGGEVLRTRNGKIESM
jgi:hypothetical protein